MGKELVRNLSLALLLVVGLAGMYLYYGRLSAESRLREEQEKNRVLREVISRLTSERRVAEMLVLDQKVVAGVKTSTVLFAEYARSEQRGGGGDGRHEEQGPPQTLPPRTFVVRGENTHIDAMVIKFDPQLVGEGDPLRGASIALFTRIYGDATAPDEAERIDTPGVVPAVYRGADPQISKFELELWRNFWTLATDEAARKERGVRAVVGQGLWEPLKPNTLYTVTLEANGGLNLERKAIPEVFRRALSSQVKTQ